MTTKTLTPTNDTRNCDDCGKDFEWESDLSSHEANGGYHSFWPLAAINGTLWIAGAATQRANPTIAPKKEKHND